MCHHALACLSCHGILAYSFYVIISALFGILRLSFMLLICGLLLPGSVWLLILVLRLFRGQAVTGIAFPSGSDKLYTGGKDESVRMWDCQSGQVAISLFMSSESYSLLIVTDSSHGTL